MASENTGTCSGFGVRPERSISRGGGIELRNPHLGHEERPLLRRIAQTEANIHCLAFSPTDDLLASAGDEGVVTLRDLRKKVVPPPPPTTDEVLRKLLGAYRSYGLPTPPADVKLVRFDLGEQRRSLGLLMKPAQGRDKKANFWHMARWSLFRGEDSETVKFDVIEPTPAALRGRSSRWDLWDDDLAAAIHCKALGWDALASSLFESKDDIIPELAESDFAAKAWEYWKDELQERDGNWPEIARRLRTIANDRPNAVHPYEMEFLRSLEAAVVPSKAKPGSLEAMVDALIEIRRGKHDAGFGNGDGDDSPDRKLGLRGFEAVPILIEHLEDERLTKMYRHGFNNFRGYQYRVCDFATNILQDLAGSDLGALASSGRSVGQGHCPRLVERCQESRRRSLPLEPRPWREGGDVAQHNDARYHRPEI